MTNDSTEALPVQWDQPDAGVWEAIVQRTIDVSLEVFQPDDDDPERYEWWAVSEGRLVAYGSSVGLDAAKADCEASLR